MKTRLFLLLTLMVLPIASYAQDSGFEDLFVDETDQTAIDQPTTYRSEPETAATPEPTPEPTRRQNRRVSIEEIVVTAQKREENLQDVPISVNAFSGEELDAKGISGPADLPRITPGLVLDQLAGYSLIYIRGVGTDAFIPSVDPAVATYIDGVYFPFAQQQGRKLDVVERIEVLKGPQGTLFGRNSTGGAINIITKDPDAESWGGDLKLTTGSFDLYGARLYLSGPITETLSISLGGLYEQSDEYYRLGPNTTMDEFQKNEDEGYRVKLRWAPTEWFDATLGTYALSSQGAHTNLFNNSEASPLVAPLGVGPSPDYVYDGDAVSFSMSESDVHYATLQFHPEWFDIKSISAYQLIENASASDFDGSGPTTIVFASPRLFFEGFTQEIQVISNDSGILTELFGRPLQWIAGGFYIDSEAGYDPVVIDNSILNDPLGLGLLPGSAVNVDGKLDTESTSYFFQSTWNPANWLGITVGGRYQSEERLIFDAGVSAVTAGIKTTLLDHADDTQRTHNFSPRIVLDLTPGGSDNLYYLSYSKGFKSGTFNIVSVDTPDEVKPEQVKSFELGAKTVWLDGNVRLNAALFRNEIRDFHVQLISVASGGTINLDNAESALVEGAEIDLTWAVTPDLILSVGAAYLDGVYDAYPDAGGYNEDTYVFFSNGDFTGNETARTPELTGNMSIFYALDLGPGELELGADAYYNSGYFFDAQNVDIAAQEEYEEINARISYYYDPWRLRASLFGNNLTDTRKQIFAFRGDLGTLNKLAPESNWAFTINWEF